MLSNEKHFSQPADRLISAVQNHRTRIYGQEMTAEEILETATGVLKERLGIEGQSTKLKIRGTVR